MSTSPDRDYIATVRNPDRKWIADARNPNIVTSQYRQMGMAVGHREVISDDIETTIAAIKAHRLAEVRAFCAESSTPSIYQWENAS